MWLRPVRGSDVVIVAQSLGAFVAPLVAERVPVELVVLVAPMIPAPSEAPADFWSDTGYADEAREQYDDVIELFYQDVPPALVAEASKRTRRQSEARMGEPSPLRGWPDVPTRVLIGRDDRLLPPAFVRRIARERLGIVPDEMDGGHTPALSHPEELADRLQSYVRAARSLTLTRAGQSTGASWSTNDPALHNNIARWADQVDDPRPPARVRTLPIQDQAGPRPRVLLGSGDPAMSTW